MIILRHLSSQLITTLTAVTVVLLSIVMTSRLISYLSKSLQGQLSPEFLLTVILLKIPSFLELILPLAFLIAVLLAYGKKYTDSEMVILHASGLGPFKLFMYTLPTAIGVACITGLVTLYLSPQASLHYATILEKERKTADVELAKQEQFRPLGRSGVIYASEVEPTSRMLSQVFMAEINDTSPKNPKTTIIRAKSGEKQLHSKYGQNYFILTEGARYDGIPGDKNYTITEFTEMGQHMRQPDYLKSYTNDAENRSTKALFESQTLEDKAALQWRITLPLIVLEMALIGVPLSKTNPRKGGYARVIPAIIFFMVYLVTLNSMQAGIIKGSVNPTIGLWPLHLIPILLGGFLLLKEHHWTFFKRSSKQTT